MFHTIQSGHGFPIHPTPHRLYLSLKQTNRRIIKQTNGNKQTDVKEKEQETPAQTKSIKPQKSEIILYKQEVCKKKKDQIKLSDTVVYKDTIT